MQYTKNNNTISVSFDRGEEILSNILDICKKEQITSAIFSGKGVCGDVSVSTFIKEKNNFITNNISGLLEIVSMNGNISTDEHNKIFHHAQAIFSYLDNDKVKFIGGHLTHAIVSNNVEIKIKPVQVENKNK